MIVISAVATSGLAGLGTASRQVIAGAAQAQPQGKPAIVVGARSLAVAGSVSARAGKAAVRLSPNVPQDRPSPYIAQRLKDIRTSAEPSVPREVAQRQEAVARRQLDVENAVSTDLAPLREAIAAYVQLSPDYIPGRLMLQPDDFASRDLVRILPDKLVRWGGGIAAREHAGYANAIAQHRQDLARAYASFDTQAKQSILHERGLMDEYTRLLALKQAESATPDELARLATLKESIAADVEARAEELRGRTFSISDLDQVSAATSQDWNQARQRVAEQIASYGYRFEPDHRPYAIRKPDHTSYDRRKTNLGVEQLPDAFVSLVHQWEYDIESGFFRPAAGLRKENLLDSMDQIVQYMIHNPESAIFPDHYPQWQKVGLGESQRAISRSFADLVDFDSPSHEKMWENLFEELRFHQGKLPVSADSEAAAKSIAYYAWSKNVRPPLLDRLRYRLTGQPVPSWLRDKIEAELQQRYPELYSGSQHKKERLIAGYWQIAIGHAQQTKREEPLSHAQIKERLLRLDTE